MDYTNIDIIQDSIKPVRWMGSSKKDIRDFAKDARHLAGRELLRVQLGREPLDGKPMKTVGAGVAELRVHTGTEHRVIYIAKFEEAIYVLHAFEKKSRKTAPRDIEIARRRLKELLRQRGQGGQPRRGR